MAKWRREQAIKQFEYDNATECACKNNGDLCGFCERREDEQKIRRTAYHIFVNVNLLSAHVAQWHAYEHLSVAECQTVVDVHKRTAVDRILHSDGNGPDPTAAEWDRFLTNTNI